MGKVNWGGWFCVGCAILAYAVGRHADPQPFYHHKATLGTYVVWDYWSTNPPVWQGHHTTWEDAFYLQTITFTNSPQFLQGIGGATGRREAPARLRP